MKDKIKIKSLEVVSTNKISNGIKKVLLIFMFVLTLMPAVPVLAQQSGGGGSSICDDSVDNVADVLLLGICIMRRALVPLLITLSIVLFIVGVIKYIAKADEAAQREEGRRFMIYGIVALFVMVSIWGLVGILQGTFGLGTDTLIPQLQDGV